MANRTTLGVAPARDRQTEANKRAGVRLQRNGLLDLAETPAHLVDVAKLNAKSPLFRLLAEVRNRIFKYAMGGYTIKIGYGEFPSRVQRREKSGYPFALQQTCRQAYAETATSGHKLNIFFFVDRIGLTDPVVTAKIWAARRLGAQIAAISSIAVLDRPFLSYMHDSFTWGGSRMASTFPSLKHLHLCGDYKATQLLRFFLTVRWDPSILQYGNIGHFAGWGKDQFDELIQVTFGHVHGEGFKVVVERAPTFWEKGPEGFGFRRLFHWSRLHS